MTSTASDQLSDILEQIAESLDIPDEVREEAVQKYEEVGHWLEEQDKVQGRRPPTIYPQGSFRLGTVIRPKTDNDEYDVDLVYERDLRKASISQEQLKAEAGKHLRSYVDHCKRSHKEVPKLTAGARCWRLDYPDRFHMDILPAIPDDDGRCRGTLFCDTAIQITDRDLHEWQFSNPIGYGEWFKGTMLKQFHEKRAALGKVLLESKGLPINNVFLKEAAEEIPEYRVKTPLQRAVQILKRHRDHYFQDDGDNRPVSIILTTLAARSYDNEADLVDALLKLVKNMPKHIERRYENGTYVSWVANPVNPKENFADRWQDEEHPEREKKFRAWLVKVDEDLTSALKGGGVHKVIGLLGNTLGESVVNKAAAALGHSVLQQRQSGGLRMASGSGLLGSLGDIPVREHTNYGVDETTGD